MFTGIIEEMGQVLEVQRRENLFVLMLKANKVAKGIKLGESVAVNGVCLSVVKINKKCLSFDLMKETIEATSLKNIKPANQVNLERAMKADSRFGGHFVTGHVDTVGVINKIVKLKNYVEFQVKLSKKFMKYIVAKGSVCLDGISLTVGRVSKDGFSVYLIPVTLRVTTFGQKKTGDVVNVETDILARYILR